MRKGCVPLWREAALEEELHDVSQGGISKKA